MKKFLVVCDRNTLNPIFAIIKQSPEILLKIRLSEYGIIIMSNLYFNRIKSVLNYGKVPVSSMNYD